VDFLINHLLINSPAAMLEAKRLLTDIAGMGVGEDGMEICIQRIVAIRLSEEGREGIQAMLETRKPSWMD
jgi:methylglutaconyl-CoA hydratase